MASSGYEVVFHGERKVEVHHLTDGELLLGARMGGDHGIWLAVLEKAFGLLRAHTSAKTVNPAELKSAVAVELVPFTSDNKDLKSGSPSRC